jgi:hypothetical protein
MSNHSKYIPLDIVSGVHDVVHLSNTFQRKPHTFEPTESYFHNAVTLPCVITLVAVAILLVFFALYCTLRCHTVHQRGRLRPGYGAGVALLIVFLAAQTVLVGVLIYLDGAHNVANGLEDWRNGLEHIDFSLRNMEHQLERSVHSLVNGSCTNPALSTVRNRLRHLVLSARATVLGGMDGVSEATSTLTYVRHYVSYYGINVQGVAFFVLYAVMVGVWLVFAITARVSKDSSVACTIIVITVFCLLLAVVSMYQMAVVMTAADFCVTPEENILKLVSDSTIHSVLEFYLYCPESGRIASRLVEAENVLFGVKRLVAVALGVGFLDSCVALRDALGPLNTTMFLASQTLQQAQCQKWSYIWEDSIRGGGCEEAYTGFYVMWIAVWAVSLGLVAANAVEYYAFPAAVLPAPAPAPAGPGRTPGIPSTSGSRHSSGPPTADSIDAVSASRSEQGQGQGFGFYGAGSDRGGNRWGGVEMREQSRLLATGGGGGSPHESYGNSSISVPSSAPPSAENIEK